MSIEEISKKFNKLKSNIEGIKNLIDSENFDLIEFSKPFILNSMKDLAKHLPQSEKFLSEMTILNQIESYSLANNGHDENAHVEQVDIFLKMLKKAEDLIEKSIYSVYPQLSIYYRFLSFIKNGFYRFVYPYWKFISLFAFVLFIGIGIWQIRQNKLNEKRGLICEYFRGSEFKDLIYSRKDLAVDFNWGNAYPIENFGDLSIFSARWKGWITFPSSGKYEIIGVADDGIKVWIDDKLIVDNNFNWREPIVVSLNDFKQGKFPIRIDFVNYGGPSRVQLLWRPISMDSREVIPSQYLSPQ
ncbi:MAG: PA14 domain-containing protein [Elusimicrobiota bacterium]